MIKRTNGKRLIVAVVDVVAVVAVVDVVTVVAVAAVVTIVTVAGERKRLVLEFSSLLLLLRHNFVIDLFFRTLI